MAQITQVITIHDYNKMTDEQKAALSENNMLAIVQQDWQQVRIQAAINAMDIVKGAYNVHNDMERLVHHAVKMADALIEELKKGGEQ